MSSWPIYSASTNQFTLLSSHFQLDQHLRNPGVTRIQTQMLIFTQGTVPYIPMSELFAEILSNAKQAHHLSTDSARLPSAPPGTGGHIPVLVRTHSTRTHCHHRGAGNISAYSTDTHCPAVCAICTEDSPGMLTLSAAVSAPPRCSPFLAFFFFFSPPHFDWE